MYKVLMVLMAMLLMIGCATKEEKALLDTFNKDLSYNKYLLKTEKAQFLGENNISKVLLTATYLYTPTSEKNDTRDEEFIVGLQFEDANMSFEDNDFNLTLDSNVSTELTLLEHDDERLKEISFVSEWGEYYFLSFNHTKKEKFDLVFNSKTYGKKILGFSKRAKYVYTKKAFD